MFLSNLAILFEYAVKKYFLTFLAVKCTKEIILIDARQILD